MNIYHPYEVLADTDNCLHLKETEVRERAQFISSRVLPIFLILFMWFLLQQVGASIPMGWIYVIVFATLIAAGFLLFRSYITELKIIPGKEIFYIQKSIIGVKEKRIAISDVKTLKLKRKKGVLFTVHTKKDHKYLLLAIPASFVDEHHVKLVAQRFQELLNVPVTGL